MSAEVPTLNIDKKISASEAESESLYEKAVLKYGASFGLLFGATVMTLKEAGATDQDTNILKIAIAGIFALAGIVGVASADDDLYTRNQVERGIVELHNEDYRAQLPAA